MTWENTAVRSVPAKTPSNIFTIIGRAHEADVPVRAAAELELWPSWAVHRAPFNPDPRLHAREPLRVHVRRGSRSAGEEPQRGGGERERREEDCRQRRPTTVRFVQLSRDSAR